MTNFQGLKSARVTPQQVWIAAPVVVGVGLALAVAGFWGWPQWQRLQLDEQNLQQLDEQRQRLPLLRAQITKLAGDLAEAELKRQQILGLVAGSGEIVTFMTQLSEEAQRTGVQLDGYEPIVETAPAEPKKNNRPAGKSDKPPATPVDPLLAPGLQKTSLLLVARGDGPQLLAFLRRLEALSLLVVQSDLQVKVDKPEPKQAGAKIEASLQKPVLRISLGLYAKSPQNDGLKKSAGP